MAKKGTDDFFEIVYVILTELYACLRAGVNANLDAIGCDRFGINSGYMMEILWNLKEKNYITGININTSEAGSRLISDYDKIKITMDGIEYLQDNGKMKKIYEKVKQIRDILPGL